MPAHSVASTQVEGKFVNSEIQYESGLGDIVGISMAYLTAKRDAPEPAMPVPLKMINKAELDQTNEAVIYRLGHSTLLMKIDGSYVLADPVFSERASPFSFVGPKRFHQPPISMEELPQISAVILSHDHYDHLDKAAILTLANKVDQFVTPLKVGKTLVKWGIDPKQITELDWWQDIKIGSLTLTATPAQHFSGRGLFDRDKTLWAGWAIKGEQANVFYTGDTGYFSGFKEIGERLGPFDLSMVETGAYNKLWKNIHMHPSESMQAHLDLNAKAMMPVHNGTFDLSLHDWYEPLESILNLAQENKVRLITPIFGEAVMIKDPQPTQAWWQSLVVEEKLKVAGQF
ncbi:hydrolase [Marinomonas sp. S3726]|nr:hydrolase [Marinomonas sp. S3726]